MVNQSKNISSTIYVEESNASLFWGLVVLVCTAAGTWLLIGSFVSMDGDLLTSRQVLTLILFTISFLGIFKLTKPRYRITLSISGDTLQITINKGEITAAVRNISVQDITDLKFMSHEPRSRHEALFDFSMSYRLMYRDRNHTVFTDLMDTDDEEVITLTAEDIAKIMRFIKSRNSSIHIPAAQADFFNV